MRTNVQRYLRMMEELREVRHQEQGLLEKMDLLWQAMDLEEKEEIRALNLNWPSPVLTPQEYEDKHGER